MNFKFSPLFLGSVAAILFSQSAAATTLILDSTNGYSVSFGSGSVSQVDWASGANGGLTIAGFTIAAGTPATADFTMPLTFTGGRGGGNGAALVGQSLTFQDNSNQDLFQVDVTFFRSPRGRNSVDGVGVIPAVDNSAGFSFEVTQVPEPSTALLAGLAGFGLLRRRRTH